MSSKFVVIHPKVADHFADVGKMIKLGKAVLGRQENTAKPRQAVRR
jgi:hypothetical protein